MTTHPSDAPLIWRRAKSGGCVYALLFTNGAVKVGKSAHLLQRFNSHLRHADNTWGADLADFYFTRTHATYSDTEDMAIGAAVSLLTPDSRRLSREWFLIIDFQRLSGLLAELDPTKSYTGPRPWERAA